MAFELQIVEVMNHNNNASKMYSTRILATGKRREFHNR